MRRSVRVWLIVVIAVFGVAAAGSVVYFLAVGSGETTRFPTSTASLSPEPAPSFTSAPPSPSAGSENPVPSPNPTDEVIPEPAPSAEGPTVVTMVSSGADRQGVYASGLVTGTVASGGVCVLVATSADGQVLTGERDPRDTPAALNCGLIELAAGGGEWTLVLSYRSDSGTSASDPVKVVQP